MFLVSLHFKLLHQLSKHFSFFCFKLFSSCVFQEMTFHFFLDEASINNPSILPLNKNLVFIPPMAVSIISIAFCFLFVYILIFLRMISHQKKHNILVNNIWSLGSYNNIYRWRWNPNFIYSTLYSFIHKPRRQFNSILEFITYLFSVYFLYS